MGVGCFSCFEKKSHSLILVGLDAAGKVVLANIVPLFHKRSSSFFVLAFPVFYVNR